MNVRSIVRLVGLPTALIGATVLAPTTAQASAVAPSQVSSASSQAALPWQLVLPQVNDCSGSAVVDAVVRGLVPGRHYSFVSNDSRGVYSSVDPRPALPVVADKSGTTRARYVNEQTSAAQQCVAGWFVIDTGNATVHHYVMETNPYPTVLRGSTAVRIIRPDVLSAQDGYRPALQSRDHRNPLPPALTSHYNLIQQSDGNLVLGHNGKAIWNSGTVGNPGARFTLQSDGNLVVRSKAGEAVWNSGTARPGSAPRVLTLQDDGNVVLRDSTNHKAVWNTGTAGR